MPFGTRAEARRAGRRALYTLCIRYGEMILYALKFMHTEHTCTRSIITVVQSEGTGTTPRRAKEGLTSDGCTLARVRLSLLERAYERIMREQTRSSMPWNISISQPTRTTSTKIVYQTDDDASVHRACRASRDARCVCRVSFINWFKRAACLISKRFTLKLGACNTLR